MTLDMHPKGWRQTARLFWLWLELPEGHAEKLIDALPESAQNRFDAFLLMLQTPSKALKELETYAKRGDLETIDALVGKLPRMELEKLVKAGLKQGKLIGNLPKMGVEELRDLVVLCSYPKNILAFFVFIEGLDAKRKESLLA